MRNYTTTAQLPKRNTAISQRPIAGLIPPPPEVRQRHWRRGRISTWISKGMTPGELKGKKYGVTTHRTQSSDVPETRTSAHAQANTPLATSSSQS